MVTGKLGLVFSKDASRGGKADLEDTLRRQVHAPDLTMQPGDQQQSLVEAEGESKSLTAGDRDTSRAELEEESRAPTTSMKMLTTGQCFGEMALMVEDSKRSCGVVALEETHLAAIHRSHFSKILRSLS